MALIDIMRRPRAVEGVRSSFALPAWLFPVGAVVFAASLTGFLVVNHALGFGGYDLTVYLAGGEALAVQAVANGAVLLVAVNAGLACGHQIQMRRDHPDGVAPQVWT